MPQRLPLGLAFAGPGLGFVGLYVAMGAFLAPEGIAPLAGSVFVGIGLAVSGVLLSAFAATRIEGTREVSAPSRSAGGPRWVAARGILPPPER